MLFRATLAEPKIAPGPESLEVKLFAWDAIPEVLAFPSVRWALDHHRALGDATSWAPFGNPEPSRSAG